MIRFTWDPAKAASNLQKHGISFEEAASVFGDPLSETFDDPDHSIDEERFVIVGRSRNDRLLFVSHLDSGVEIRIISARPLTSSEAKCYEEDSINDELRPEYDLSKLTGRVRGKYAVRYNEGNNLILLDDDVASAFPNSQAVNEALRSLLPKSNRKPVSRA